MQVDWYRTRIPGNSSLAQLRKERGDSLTPPAAGAALNASSTTCVLRGVGDADPASYMARECIYPYGGRLCATCAPGHALNLDFQCTE